MSVGISQKKLAEKLGLSRATISFVLNGKAEKYRVPPDTVARVLKAADEYGHVPNKLAQSLKSKRTGVVAISIIDFMMDWAHRLHMGVNAALRDVDTVPLFAVRGVDPKREREELRWMLERRADGFIIGIPMAANAELYREIIAKKIPVIFVGDVPLGMEKEANYVVWDAPKALATIVEKVILSGRKRLAWFSPAHPELGTITRIQAFRDITHRHGLSIPERHITNIRIGDQSFGEILENWIQTEIIDSKEPADGLICLNDSMGSIMISLLARRGIRVPDDVVVTGLGNLPIPGSAFDQIITAEEPLQTMGEVAAERLLHLIETPNAHPVREIIDFTEIYDRPGVISDEIMRRKPSKNLPSIKTVLE